LAETVTRDEVEYWHAGGGSCDHLSCRTKSLGDAKVSEVRHGGIVVDCVTGPQSTLNPLPNKKQERQKDPAAVALGRKGGLKGWQWGKDDYSLEIKNLPQAQPVQQNTAPASEPSRRRRKADSRQQDLFAVEAQP
jgi:hypothetical protein